MRATARLARWLFGACATRLFPRWYHRRAVLSGARLHDMVAEPDEQFYAEEYLAHLRPALAAAGAKTVLDLGCGHGRIAIPLARDGYRVTGVDWSADALAAASRYAAGVAGLELQRADIVEWLRGAPDHSWDAVLALEVLYMMDAWREAVREAYRVLGSGGVCALGFRPRLYYMRYHARRGEFDLVARIAEGREGRLGNLCFNWHSRDEVGRLLGEAGFRDVRCVGIGMLSGIAGDPLEALARPSRLSPSWREALLALETRYGEVYADEGRYLLALARK